MISIPDPVLVIEESSLRQFDPQNPSQLFSLWSAFSKASCLVEQGKRLEHMSWRLWAHQSICERRKRRPPAEMPALSTSVDSVASDLNVPESHSGFGTQLTTGKLQHLVSEIKHKQDLRPPQGVDFARSNYSLPLECSVSTEVTTDMSPPSSDGTTSSSEASSSSGTMPDAGKSSAQSEHSIVRGFEPGSSSMYRPVLPLATSPPTPILKSRPSKPTDLNVSKARFQIGSGGSDASASDGSTLQENMSPKAARDTSRKQTSFKQEVTEIPPKPKFQLADEDAIDSDSDFSDSAIDDDDAWEDDGEADIETEQRQLTFPRVDSRHDLVSRRSAIWDQLHAPQRSASAAQLRRSRTSTPIGPSMPASPSTPAPIALALAPEHPPCPPMAPWETRKHMLTTELGVSLRKQLLNERQTRNLYSPPVAGRAQPAPSTDTKPRRAQTSVDVRSLAADSRPRSSRASSVWDFPDASGEYHQTGW